MPSEIGPALDAANRGLAVLPKEKIAALLDETSQAVGGLGPALQRLVDSTQAIVGDFKDEHRRRQRHHRRTRRRSWTARSTRVTRSTRWARNLNILAAQTAATGPARCKACCQQAAPTADQVNAVFSDVRESLPQTLANLEIVVDMLKRYHKGLEQMLVFLPQGASIAQAVAAPFDEPGRAGLRRCRSTSRRRV